MLKTRPVGAGPTRAKVSVSPSTSVADAELVSGVSSAVLSLLSFATGASFTELTVMVTVALFDSAVPSDAR